jgi:hypothetical protein
MSTKNTIRLYGCGGTGINIAKPYITSEAASAGEADVIVGWYHST